MFEVTSKDEVVNVLDYFGLRFFFEDCFKTYASMKIDKPFNPVYMGLMDGNFTICSNIMTASNRDGVHCKWSERFWNTQQFFEVDAYSDIHAILSIDISGKGYLNYQYKYKNNQNYPVDIYTIPNSLCLKVSEWCEENNIHLMMY
jgi:hypothetical protein